MDYLENILGSNISVLFIIALFYAAVSGVKLRESQRMVLVYSFSLLIYLFGSIDFYVIILGIIIVSFLILEVFCNDEKLTRIFSLGYKVLDYLYRMTFEFFGLYFILTLVLLQFFKGVFPTLFWQMLGVAAMLVFAVLTSRKKYSTNTITETILAMTSHSPVIDALKWPENVNKFNILAAMEDRQFFVRKENQHSFTWKQINSRLKKRSLKRFFEHPIERTYSILSRGYGTIEMQLIRTVGISFGSYNCRIRRKLYELLYANMIFNSYMRLFGKDSLEREYFRYWIMQSYIANVSVKFAPSIFYPGETGTIQKVFKRSLSEISDEEFFVWCLGLPYYSTGVGQNAIDIHSDIIEEFCLDREKIMNALDFVNASV